MPSEILKKIYIQCCCDELKTYKPGNHSSISKILGMSELKFRYAAKISANYLTDKNLSLGESIYLAAKNCKIELNSNYNLGIIILCAPIIKVIMNKPSCFKNNLKVLLDSISKKDGQLILESIKFVKPAGISNYTGKGNINDETKNLSFSEIMKVGSKWDRISKCYSNNYDEVINYGLPIFESLKEKIPQQTAIEFLYLNYLSKSPDSHIQRKHGFEKAQIVMNKSLKTIKRMKIFKENQDLLRKLDFYLKKYHLNPGTCADLTVTTLLIKKIKDIFKLPI